MANFSLILTISFVAALTIFRTFTKSLYAWQQKLAVQGIIQPRLQLPDYLTLAFASAIFGLILGISGSTMIFHLMNLI